MLVSRPPSKDPGEAGRRAKGEAARTRPAIEKVLEDGGGACCVGGG